ncbi:MAG: hypothetical protein U0528_10365 [Anaerolineae bacterium]
MTVVGACACSFPRRGEKYGDTASTSRCIAIGGFSAIWMLSAFVEGRDIHLSTPSSAAGGTGASFGSHLHA